MEIDEIQTPQLNQNGYHRNTLTKERVGALLIYPIDYTPNDCLSCDGYSLLIVDYKELFAVIGTKFNQTNDTQGTFRVPDYNVTGRFLQPNSQVGKQIDAGLPNIYGWLSDINSGSVNCGGAFYYASTCQHKANNVSAITGGWGFNANLSNAIYGNSSTVQPPSQTVHLVIKYK